MLGYDIERQVEIGVFKEVLVNLLDHFGSRLFFQAVMEYIMEFFSQFAFISQFPPQSVNTLRSVSDLSREK